MFGIFATTSKAFIAVRVTLLQLKPLVDVSCHRITYMSAPNGPTRSLSPFHCRVAKRRGIESISSI